jgi:hypothetical protein
MRVQEEGVLGMAFDRSKIGKLAAELMDELETQFEEDAEIGDVALVVEITTPNSSQIATTFSNPRGHVNLGLVDFARESMLRKMASTRSST